MELEQVRRLAAKWYAKTSRCLEFGDLLGAAAIGAIEADKSKPGDSDYAALRIKWRILDELQSRHQVKRGAYKAGFRRVEYNEALEASEEMDLVLDKPKLENAMAGLTAREKEAIKLRYWQGLNDIEAGRQLGISSVRVGQLNRAALCKLQTYFGD